jgi:hypothetical protein
MTASEIILAMVEGLVNPITDQVVMHSFGHNEILTAGKKKETVCFGCAATNTIANILGIVPGGLGLSVGKTKEYTGILNITPTTYGFGAWDYKLFKTKKREWKKTDLFISSFELAIDALRVGDIAEYNRQALGQEFACIDACVDLQILHHNYTAKDLNSYRELAENQ